jgi:outer membrane protein insertion porin family
MLYIKKQRVNTYIRHLILFFTVTFVPFSHLLSQSEEILNSNRSALVEPITPDIQENNTPFTESSPDSDESEDDTEELESVVKPGEHKVINKIIFEGSTLSDSALQAKSPFIEGELFEPVKTKKLIDNLYKLGYFNNIKVDIQEISPDAINLYVILTEKKRIEQVVYKNNQRLSNSDIEKKLKLNEVPAMDESDLAHYAKQIQHLYAEKNYHNVKIDTQLEPTERNTARAIFTINEGYPSVVKRVTFKGNKAFTGKQLRSMIFTREDWLGSFLDKAGSFQPDALDYDKMVIENFYQSNGYLAARVKDIDVQHDPKDPSIVNVTYTIEEGDIYTIKSVSAPGNDLLTEAQLLAVIIVKPGQLYSKDLIRKSMEDLRLLWGQFGYIYADIEPAVVPNYEDKTVSITFNSELGSKVFLNRLTIIGNKKTRDYVIRRMINLNEGDLLTAQGMEESKTAIESLGFFDPRSGVNWKINRIDETTADLELMVQEIKTGKLFAQVGFGGADRDPKSPASSLKVSAGVGDRNLLGSGISYNLAVNYAREDQGVLFTIGNSWLFDRPITGALETYHRRTTYEEFRNLEHVPVEIITGGSTIFGYSPFGYLTTRVLLNSGIERIRYAQPIEVSAGGKTEEERAALQDRLRRQFQPGTFTWAGGTIGQDLRNHPVHPNRGYQWSVNSKNGLPVHSNFGFIKFEGDITWFTPLINEYDLIFCFHAHAGFVKALPGRVIPYRELFHLGGPATVRGYNFGQIGPSLFGDSLGGTKAFWVNSELVFHITKDFATRAVLFYDGGASWDTPDVNPLFTGILKNNKFRYRHAIGFGIRLTNPAPIKIDWGFKLDRNKKRGETPYEVHFTMAQDF